MELNFNDYLVSGAAGSETSRFVDFLAETGLATFEIPIAHARETIIALANELGTVYPHAHSDEHGVTTIAPQPGTTLASGLHGFGTGSLDVHTDCSSAACPPAYLLNMCLQDSAVGGASTFVDMQEVHCVLSRSYPDVLAALSRPGLAIFGKGDFQHCGSIFERSAGDGICVRFRLDDLGYFSSSLLEPLRILVDLIRRHTVTMMLSPGQGYCLNNGRWLHGRTAFIGEREVLRVLVDPCRTRAAALTRGFRPKSIVWAA